MISRNKRIVSVLMKPIPLSHPINFEHIFGIFGLLQTRSGVFGARLTGAGFGGACVALVASGQAEAVAQGVLQNYEAAGYQGQILVLSNHR